MSVLFHPFTQLTQNITISFYQVCFHCSQLLIGNFLGKLLEMYVLYEHDTHVAHGDGSTDIRLSYVEPSEVS